jgi:hypothetical protein
MRKAVLAIICVCVLSFTAVAQEFHIIYLRLDNTMNMEQMNEKLTRLIQRIEASNNKFVVLFSNESPKMLTSNKEEVQATLDKWWNSYAFKSIVLNEEIDAIFDIFDTYKLVRAKEKKIVVNKFTSIVFDVFVGDSFFESDYQNFLLAKTIYAIGLENSPNIAISYYNSSQLSTNAIQFGSVYNKNNCQIFLN